MVSHREAAAAAIGVVRTSRAALTVRKSVCATRESSRWCYAQTVGWTPRLRRLTPEGLVMRVHCWLLYCVRPHLVLLKHDEGGRTRLVVRPTHALLLLWVSTVCAGQAGQLHRNCCVARRPRYEYRGHRGSFAQTQSCSHCPVVRRGSPQRRSPDLAKCTDLVKCCRGQEEPPLGQEEPPQQATWQWRQRNPPKRSLSRCRCASAAIWLRRTRPHRTYRVARRTYRAARTLRSNRRARRQCWQRRRYPCRQACYL